MPQPFAFMAPLAPVVMFALAFAFMPALTVADALAFAPLTGLVAGLVAASTK